MRAGDVQHPQSLCEGTDGSGRDKRQDRAETDKKQDRNGMGDGTDGDKRQKETKK